MGKLIKRGIVAVLRHLGSAILYCDNFMRSLTSDELATTPGP